MSCGRSDPHCSRLLLLLWVGLCCGAVEEEPMQRYQDLCSYKWEALDRDNNVKYSLKLCDSSPSTGCSAGTAVCAQDLKTSSYQSVGDLSLKRLSGSVMDFNSSLKCSGHENNVQTS
ncbi:LOW QUALITY PROTEIN: cation-independent mannose-6-phosphate receptor, partial [Scomber scombrus]